MDRIEHDLKRVPADDIAVKTEIHNSQVHISYEHIGAAAFGTIINAVILSIVQWDVIDRQVIIGWFATLLTVTLWRLHVSRDFRHQRHKRDTEAWKNLFMIGVGASALLWGSTSIFLFPQDDIAHQVFLAFVLAGMSAGAVSTLSAIPSAVYLFLLTLSLPLLLALAIQQTFLHSSMAIMVLMFLIILIGVSRRYQITIFKTLQSRIMYEKANDALKFNEERFRTIFQEAPVGIFYYDKDLVIIEINQEFSTILHAPADYLIGLDMHTLPDTNVLPAIKSVLDNADGFYEGKYITKLKGIELWINLRTSPLRNANGDVIGGVGIVNDITQQKLAEEKIQHQANFDSLTGIPNRVLFKDRLQQSIARFKRHRTLTGLLFLDLDHFKTINDSLGHQVGDALLKAAAERLVGILREEDTVARLGGDEFVILLPDLGEDTQKALLKTETAAHKIHETLRQPFCDIGGHTLYTTASIGIAITGEHAVTADDLLKHADTAMYEAKKDGRDTTRFYQLRMDQWIRKRLLLENALRTAVAKDELELHYQPIVEFATGNIIGAEALLRWKHAEHGLMSPNEFIPIAEETGVILPIGKWVLEEACSQFAMWRKQFPEMEFFQKIAINVSAKQFNQHDFITQITDTIRYIGIQPHWLEIELTESVIIDNIAQTVEKMNLLREHNIGISIDDFGTGYSSLSYLKRLPFTTLKIDKAFTRDIEQDVDNARLIETIIAIAGNFKLDVITEGVESYGQYLFLYENHCHFYQGYLCSAPLQAAEFSALLTNGAGKFHPPTQ